MEIAADFPKKVKIVEVGARDGLQNEATHIPTSVKIDFINRLSETGLRAIEVTSFVSPKWIPQLSDHSEVFTQIVKKPLIQYSAFVPNVKGLEMAIEAGVKEVAVFSTPSEKFSKKNVNFSVHENLENIEKMIKLATDQKVKVRGYISCVLGCPYEGEINPQSVADLAGTLLTMGCYEISLGDTIGTGTPFKTATLMQTVLKSVPKNQLAVHFHDTFGQALVNIYVALSYGIATIDSSIAGLGGCPYAKGASGNVATEDVLYMLRGMNIETHVDFAKLISVSRFISTYLKKLPPKVAQAFANAE